MIVSKLLYGLESIPFTEQDCAKLDAFQYRGLRKILHIKHSQWSRIQNETVFITANIRARTGPKNIIIPLSEKLVLRQIKFYGHTIRADDLDLMSNAFMYQDGTRRRCIGSKRVGRPRSKRHTVTRAHTAKHLISKGIIMRYWQRHIRDNELDQIIGESAFNREI